MIGTNLFGQNNNNNNQGSSLFGNNNQNNGLFGNQNNNQNNALFGNQNSNNQNNSLFGNQNNGLFGNQNNNNQNNGLFGNQNNGLFGNQNNNNNNQGGGLFNNLNVNNNNINNLNNNNINNNNINPEKFTSVNPVIALNQTNDLQNIQVNRLPKEYQDAILKLKKNLKNQEIQLDELARYSQRLTDLVDENNKAVGRMGEFNSFMNEKLNKYDSILAQVKNNYKVLSDAFEQELKNINLMEEDRGYKIEIPTKFLVNYSRNLNNKVALFNKKLRDFLILMKVYYSESNNELDFNNDIIESTLSEYIRIVKCLVESTVNEERLVNEISQAVYHFMSFYGENIDTVRDNINKYSMDKSD